MVECYDCVIVLSHQVINGDLTEDAKKRIEKGVSLLKNTKFIIMTGGRSSFDLEWYVPKDGELSSCDYMKKYAIDKGVPEEKILVQRYSSDTVGEAYFTKQLLLKPNKFRKLLIITNCFHVDRSRKIWKFILNGDYEIYFDCVKTKLDEDLSILKNEKESLAVFEKTFSNASPGDDEAIERILYSKHKIYSVIPKNLRKKFYS